MSKYVSITRTTGITATLTMPGSMEKALSVSSLRLSAQNTERLMPPLVLIPANNVSNRVAIDESAWEWKLFYP